MATFDSDSNFCSPYRIDVHRLWHSVGQQVPVCETIVLPERIGLDMIALPANSELSCDMTISTLTDGMLLSGEITGTLHGECARCLAPIRRALQVPITQLFVYQCSEQEQDAEIYQLTDYIMDIEQTLITYIIDTLPFAPLCSADCLGLCSQCGIDLNSSPNHAHDDIDPRFASLRNFFPAQTHTPPPLA